MKTSPLPSIRSFGTRFAITLAKADTLAPALVVDGRVEYAAQQERFTRITHDPGFREGKFEPD